MDFDMSEMLQRSSSRHDHLCPRQVLGVRIGIAGMAALGWSRLRTGGLGFIILETDGCFADGIEAATGATIGHRTLRVSDSGKIAATFVDAASGGALRISPRHHVRAKAREYARGESRHYFAQLTGYQSMPDEELLRMVQVSLDPPAPFILSSPAARVVCAQCGEEVFNGREVEMGGLVLCRQCAGMGYYLAQSTSVPRQKVGTATLDR